ncbi:MAG: ATP-binding protein, partial [Solirubrobacterales bacterium]
YVEMSESTNDAVTTYATGDTTIESDSIDRTRGLLEENRVLTNTQEAKNEFLSHMSHELRTPLTAISGFAELLTVSGLDRERTEWASTIVKASRHLAKLVNEILDISRIESGELSLSIEPVPVTSMIDDAIELMRPTAARLDVDLAVSGQIDGVSVLADNQRLKQVLINLLSNAIKYNRVGGSVTVAVRADSEQVSIAVTDTGEGLRQDSLEKLFTPFERMDAATTDVEGTGLGLALSKHLVDAMNGSLTAESVVGVGTTFTIELRRVEPVTAIETATGRSPLDVRAYSQTKNLLYIEDTVANAKLVEQILVRRPSVRVLPAMLGRLGFELAVDHQPDMILLDLHLPDVNGAEVLAKLKSEKRTQHIPVVILSADATGRQYKEVMDAGALEFLTKPIRVSELLEAVDRYLVDS